MGTLRATRSCTFNQTMAGRTADKARSLRLWTLVSQETRRVRRRVTSVIPCRTGPMHVAAVGVLFWFVSGVCGIFGGGSTVCWWPTRA